MTSPRSVDWRRRADDSALPTTRRSRLQLLRRIAIAGTIREYPCGDSGFLALPPGPALGQLGRDVFGQPFVLRQADDVIRTACSSHQFISSSRQNPESPRTTIRPETDPAMPAAPARQSDGPYSSSRVPAAPSMFEGRRPRSILSTCAPRWEDDTSMADSSSSANCNTRGRTALPAGRAERVVRRIDICCTMRAHRGVGCVVDEHTLHQQASSSAASSYVTFL